MSIASVEVRPADIPEEQTPVRFPKAHATERNFRRKRKQLPELQGTQKHERPYTSALLKAAKCRDRSASWGRYFPHYSSLTWGLNPVAGGSQVHPSGRITAVLGDP